MVELLSLLSVGIALSMDTFSLSLGIGTLGVTVKKIIIISSIVGVMHFIMPLCGLIIGQQILKIIYINPNYLVSGILLFLALLMFKDLLHEKEQYFGLSFLEIFIFSISVSIDSFTTGIGLNALTLHPILAAIIFSFCSFIFTFLGLTIGKYSYQKLGRYATIFGILLLIIVAILHLFI